MTSASRWLWIFLFAFSSVRLWAAPGDALPAKDLLALEGDGFVKAADDARYGLSIHSPYTEDELITIASRLVGTVTSMTPSSELHSSPFKDFFEAACQPDGADVDRLVQVYGQLNPTSFEKIFCLPPLAAAWVHRELKGTDEKPEHLNLPKLEITIPHALLGAPKELLDAWSLYKRASLSYENAYPEPPRSEQISYQLNRPAFFKLVEVALAGNGSDSKRALLNFVQTGYDPNLHFYDQAQAIAMLVILLREHRLDEALGAALRASSGEMPLVRSSGKENMIAETIGTFGINWEDIIAGALVDAETREQGPGRQQWLEMLGEYGSDRAASLLAKLTQWVKPESRKSYYDALGALIESSDNVKDCKGRFGGVSSGLDAIYRKADIHTDRKLQAKSLSLIEDWVTSGLAGDDAAIALRTFERTQSPTSVPALRKLTLHHSPEIAESAATILCAMGEDTDSIVNSKPVRFQIMVNGTSLAVGSSIGWQINTLTGSVSSSTNVKEDGTVGIERKYFADPADVPRSISLSNSNLSSSETPIFCAEIPLPTDLASVTKVDVKTRALVLNLRRLRQLNSPSPNTAKMGISPHHSDGSKSCPMIFEMFEVPLTPTISLSAVEDGVYDISFAIVGAETWKGQGVVAADAKPTEILLKPGSDLRYKIIAPEGAVLYPAVLLKDGKSMTDRFDFNSDNYEGLPCGNYVLHVPSSAEGWRNRNLEDVKVGPDEIPWRERDISFTISDGSPAIIDLGQIRLEPLP